MDNSQNPLPVETSPSKDYMEGFTLDAGQSFFDESHSMNSKKQKNDNQHHSEEHKHEGHKLLSQDFIGVVSQCSEREHESDHSDGGMKGGGAGQYGGESNSHKKRRTREERLKIKGQSSSEKYTSPGKSYIKLHQGESLFDEFAKQLIYHHKAQTEETEEINIATTQVHQDQKLSTNESVTSVNAQQNQQPSVDTFEIQQQSIHPSLHKQQSVPSNQLQGSFVLDNAQSQQQAIDKVNTNLNEDINMQLYGQISMFDQLTDYNDNDNDVEQEMAHHTRRYMHVKNDGGKGEEDYSDNGEDEAGNLFLYRQKIQQINDELANFIGLMTDGLCQGEDDDDSLVDGSSNKDDSYKQSQQIDLTLGSSLQKKLFQTKFKQIIKFLNTLDSELISKQQLLDQREHTIAKLTREKGILQELLESKSKEEESWAEREKEQKALIEKLQKENDELKHKAIQQTKAPVKILKPKPSSPIQPSDQFGVNSQFQRRRNSQKDYFDPLSTANSSKALITTSQKGGIGASHSFQFIKQRSPKQDSTLIEKIMSLKHHNEDDFLQNSSSVNIEESKKPKYSPQKVVTPSKTNYATPTKSKPYQSPSQGRVLNNSRLSQGSDSKHTNNTSPQLNFQSQNAPMIKRNQSSSQKKFI